MPHRCHRSEAGRWVGFRFSAHINEASTADVKIFPAAVDGNDSRRIWHGLAGPLERKAPHTEAAALVAQAYARATAAVKCGVMSNDDAIAALVASVVSKCA